MLAMWASVRQEVDVRFVWFRWIDLVLHCPRLWLGMDVM